LCIRTSSAPSPSVAWLIASSGSTLFASRVAPGNDTPPAPRAPDARARAPRRRPCLLPSIFGPHPPAASGRPRDPGYAADPGNLVPSAAMNGRRS
jgi:hypothetical protein